MNKIVKFAFAAAFAMFATYNVCQSNTETEETSDMVLANVEALAAGEGVVISCSQSCSDGRGKCWSNRGDHCLFTGDINHYCTGTKCIFRY